VKEVSLGAFAHQDLPFEKLVAELAPSRDLSRQPLFQVLLVLQNMPQARVELGELVLEPVGFEQRSAKFDLTLSLAESGEGLAGALEYAADLFDAGTIERLAGHLGRVLEQVALDPHVRLGELELMDSAERRRVVEEWNDTAAAYPQDRCIHELFEEQAARAPDAVAVVFEEDTLSYGELDRRANQLAGHLRSLGVGPDVVVGLCLERSLEMIVGLLGILKAGGAYLPLDPDYPPDRLGFMLADAGAPVLVTCSALSQRVPAQDRTLVLLDEDAAAIGQQPASSPGPAAAPDNLAYVIYTSGSTGTPKGVMVEHRSLANYLGWAVGRYLADEGIGAPVNTPLAFDATVTSLFVPLLTGRCVELLPEGREELPALAARLSATPQAMAARHRNVE